MLARIKALLLCSLLILPLSVSAQDAKDAQTRLLKDLQLLTSEACEGRGLNTKGIELAADYIERQFAQAGLQPAAPDGSFSQRFTLTSEGTAGKKNSLLLKGPLGQTIALTPGREFNVLLQGASGKFDAPLVFVGYGISSKDPEYDDYQGLDVAGKIVVVLTDTPRKGHPTADVFAAKAGPGENPSALRHKIETAKKHGAKGVLLVNTRQRAASGDLIPRPILSMGDFAPWDLPVAHISRDLVESMLFASAGKTLKQVEQAIDADLKPRSTPLTGWTCTLETEVAHKKLAVRNIIGVSEGNGPLAKETVVIGAHYDHVGMFGTTRRFPAAMKGVSGPGSIGGVGLPLALVNESGLHHGADDNASGTSVLIEIARRFGADKKRMGRRIVFIAFTAEESGLLGSEYYVRNPVFPLADTVAMINMDQVGRLQEDKLLVGGLGSAKSFEALIDRLNGKHRFQISKEMSGFAPSDNASFYRRKIPAVWFFTGFHEQYHRPTDRLETLNVPGLARIASLIGDVAQELATESSRPEYQVTGNFDRTKTLWSMAPSIGVIPQYGDKEDGVLVQDVFKDTVAARAGLKKGDRIRAAGDSPIKDPLAFHVLSRTWKPGSKVELTVVRGDKEEKVALELAIPPGGYTDSVLGVIVNVGDFKNGLAVTGVVKDGPAARAGLQKGDRIVTLAGQPLTDRETYFNVIRAFRPGETIPVSIARGAVTMELKITIVKKTP